MDFGSIRRKNRVSQPSRSRKTFSASNLSCISCNSASVGRKTVYVTLPKDFGCEVNLCGRIAHVRKGGPAHQVGVLQVGDYLRIVDDDESSSQEIIKLQVTYGVLQVDSRPNCPLVIEIGNRSHTPLGIALTDSPDNKIEISSIQPGSLAERCGFIKPGDCIISVHTSSNETIPCSPYYSSYQIAQILRQLTSKNSSIKLTIMPSCEEKQLPDSSTEDIDIHSGGSDSTLTLVDHPSYFNSFENSNNTNLNRNNGSINLINGGIMDENVRKIEKVDEEEEENSCVLSLCLWKDRLYDDWGFSLVDLVDQNDGDTESETEEPSGNTKLLSTSDKQATVKQKNGATVYQIRPGGPAFVAGLRSSDKIIQINGRDVSQLESTMLVPILASLDDALNLVISRVPNSNSLIN